MIAKVNGSRWPGLELAIIQPKPTIGMRTRTAHALARARRAAGMRGDVATGWSLRSSSCIASASRSTASTGSCCHFRAAVLIELGRGEATTPDDVVASGGPCGGRWWPGQLTVRALFMLLWPGILQTIL